MTRCTPQIDLFSIGRRKVTASFVDTPLTSDIGAVLVGRVDRSIGVTERLAAALTDRRQRTKVQHPISDLLRQRAYQIACGYEDAIEGNSLRHDAGFQLALGRVPDGDAPLASQPTLSPTEHRRNANLLARTDDDEPSPNRGQCEVITDFVKKWGRKTPHPRRIVAKAEITSLGENPRFMITNMENSAEAVYDFYTDRGHCENHIKELENAMLGDRMSCLAFGANQFRLLVHVTAYILMDLLREQLAGTALANAQMDTLRLRLLKVAAVVRVTARRIWLELSASHPSASLWPRLVPLLR